MTKLRSLFSQKINFGLLFSFIALILFSLLLTILMLYMQPDGVYDILECTTKDNGLNILLNFLPVLLLSLLIFFISSNLIASLSITSFIMIVMAFVNRNKIHLRNDPFLPWDISLGFEVAGIAKSFGFKMIFLLIIGIAIYVLLSVVANLLIKNKKMDIKVRVIGSAILIILAFILNKPLYKNIKLNNDLHVIGNVYNQVDTFNSKGFLYSFIYAYNSNKISKPDNYNPSLVEEIINTFEPADLSLYDEVKKPHIFMIMGEAFSEISLNPAFDYTGYVDPLENYKKIKADSIYGEIVVPNIGGGTADTEFDVLTGLSTRHLRGAPFAYRLVGSNFEAMPNVLEKLGYKSEAMHPGYEWFYNRQNVFKYFGFENTVFLEDFPSDTEEKGMYVTETATIDKYIEMFENHLDTSPNVPYFNFTITIQNHGPYKDKYLADINHNTLLDTDPDDMNAISNYYEGLKDADRELKRLVDYMEDSSEPIVLLYFGDHLPAFNQSVYDTYYPDVYDRNSLESFSRLYSTPFIIYENKASKSVSSIKSNFEALKEGSHIRISSNYLGGYLFELLGYNNISPFFDYINNMRKVYPVITEQRSFLVDGSDTSEMTAEEKKSLIIYRDWEFFKIFP